MALTGLGVGAVFAVKPIQIVDGVPASETGSAISFYQLVRSVGYSVASALSATLLVGYIRPGARLPSDAGYGVAALVDLAVFAASRGDLAPRPAAHEPGGTPKRPPVGRTRSTAGTPA